jgi:Fur family ferric uptake transcriptional regulator
MTERHTRQRAALHKIFQDAGRPLSAAEVHRLAERRVRGIGMATVYRNINRLVALRQLEPVDLPGEVPRYELRRQTHHHHFLCRRCGRVYDVAGCSPVLTGRLPRGFRADGHDVVLYGICAACA